MSTFDEIKLKFNIVQKNQNNISSCIRDIKDAYVKLNELETKNNISDDDELFQYQTEKDRYEELISRSKEKLKLHINPIKELFKVITIEKKEFRVDGYKFHCKAIRKDGKKLFIITEIISGVESIKEDPILLIDLDEIENLLQQ